MVDRERVERFLRTLLGTLLVGWLLVALVVPLDPLTFLVVLVPGWLVGTVAAFALVYLGGYERLAESPLFAPRAPLSHATAAFVLLAAALKVVLTLAADAALGARAVGHAEGLAGSAVALVVAYVAVFYAGALGYVEQSERPGG